MIFHFFTVFFYQMPVFLHLMTVWEGISFSFPKGKQRREVKQMPYYAWKARNGEGRVRKGILAAGCLREAGKELEARFPHILQLRPVSPFQRLFLGRQKLTDLDRETFFRKLGLLLQGGFPSCGRSVPWKAMDPQDSGLSAGNWSGGSSVECPFPKSWPGRKNRLGCWLPRWRKLGKTADSFPLSSSSWLFFIRKSGKIRKPFSRPVSTRPWSFAWPWLWDPVSAGGSCPFSGICMLL